MKRLTKQPSAERDLRECVVFLKSRDRSVALRFIAAVDSAFRSIRCNPTTGFLSGIANLDARHVRVKKIPGFPSLLILFQETADSVCILRVLHGARDIESEFDDS